MRSSIAIWRITLLAPERAVPAIEAALDPLLDSFSWSPIDPDAEPGAGGAMSIVGHAARPLERARVVAALAAAAALVKIETPEPRIEQLADTDWLARSLRSFPPIDAGRFHLHGSHIAAPPPAGRIALVVDAGAAFGSGEHASTKGCLLALDAQLKRRRFKNALDMGCGTGVLGIALAKARPARVLAVDIDASAARIAAANGRRNGVAARLRAAAGDGYRLGLVRRRAPYDLVFANILARPLARMATPLGQSLAPGGIAILAGLLTRQERLVLAAHRSRHMPLIARLRLGEWTTLIVGRRAPAPRSG